MAMNDPKSSRGSTEGDIDLMPEKDQDDADVEAVQSTSGMIPTATDWFPSAVKDPSNPQNWPRWKKIYHTAIPTSIAFLWFVIAN